MDGNDMKKNIKKLIKKVRGSGCSEGFSLVEAVTAVFLLSIGLLSAGAVLISVSGHQRISQVITQETNLAQETIEALRNDDYTDLAGSTENYGEITSAIAFKREVTVTPNGDDTLKTIEVVVTHLGGQRVRLVTYIAR